MKTLKAVLGVAVIVGIAIFAWGVVPPYFANYQFKDDVQQEARFALASYPPKSDEDIRAILYKKALQYEIPIKPEQIRVSREGSDIIISIPYSVVVNFPLGQTYTLNFNPGTEKSMKTRSQ